MIARLEATLLEGCVDGRIFRAAGIKREASRYLLIYEDEEPTPSSWGNVECDWEYVLAVVEERVLAETPLEIEEEE